MEADIDVLRKALEAPLCRGISCITPRKKEELSTVLDSMDDNSYLSEWRVGLGILRYEFRFHDEELGNSLKGLYGRGVRGGHPKLTGVYSKQDLISLLDEYATQPVPAQGNVQTHY